MPKLCDWNQWVQIVIYVYVELIYVIWLKTFDLIKRIVPKVFIHVS